MTKITAMYSIFIIYFPLPTPHNLKYLNYARDRETRLKSWNIYVPRISYEMEIDGITKGPSLYYVSKVTGVRKMVIFADD